MPVTFVTVEDDQGGQRIDNFLLARLKGVPKSKIYTIIRKGEVRVNKGRVKPTYRIAGGDTIRIPPLKLAESKETNVSEGLKRLLIQSIVHEDANWMVVNKPNDLAVHGGSGVSAGLIESLRKIRPEEHYLELCHRIDKATSGCVVIAKKRSALRRFHQALREKKMSKTYRVVVAGRWPAKTTSVNRPLEKNVLASGERMVRVAESGKQSLTHYKILDRLDGCSHLEATPVTGRTHQIRVHCQVQGHPILGDEKYGFKEANRGARDQGYTQLFLHAKRISLPRYDDSGLLPVEQWASVEAPEPAFWQQFLQRQQN